MSLLLFEDGQMSNNAVIDSFRTKPILNSPYEEPKQYWEMDENTGRPIPGPPKYGRRPARFITPIPQPKKKTVKQAEIVIDERLEKINEADQKNKYHLAKINELRNELRKWRNLPESKWNVTFETAKLLKHWRHFKFTNRRPFFCQIEAVETAIYLTEVAPHTAKGKEFLQWIDAANNEFNRGIPRIALKMATGSGKTTVMAMIIAWQTINAVRHPNRKIFTNGFLVITPGITIKDRLSVLIPDKSNGISYYDACQLVPNDMKGDLNRARVVITNYHAFKSRKKVEISSGTLKALKGNSKDEFNFDEGPGDVLARVCPELLNIKSVIVINDEAHHCYLAKPKTNADDDLTDIDRADRQDAKTEASDNREAARLWFTGIENLANHGNVNLLRVFDLSATPFFISGSGYQQGTIFTWTMSEFGLLDAIESGIVKIPRIPVLDNTTKSDMPKYRDLWKNIVNNQDPSSKRDKGGCFLRVPDLLKEALDMLYRHYEKTFKLWEDSKCEAPPCFIVVCNNTKNSRLIYDYISGNKSGDGTEYFQPTKFPLFSNFDKDGNALALPRTILIDSKQLESDEPFNPEFRKVASDEIVKFKDYLIRSGKLSASEIKSSEIPDSMILRQVMNTVGKKGELGESVRLVVSVSMLTEGWDCATVTHIVGVRAFSSQLLCEQVIGRALRRQSYEPNEKDGLNEPEYADIFGVPFDFVEVDESNPNPKPTPSPNVTEIMAISPERDKSEIYFPRVAGYHFELPPSRLDANFTRESYLEINPDMVGPTKNQNLGVIGEAVNMKLDLSDVRANTVIMILTSYLLNRFKEKDNSISYQLFGNLKAIVSDWFNKYLVCKGGTNHGFLLYSSIASKACEKIFNAVILKSIEMDKNRVSVILDPYAPYGSTRNVNFKTSKKLLFETNEKCHINYAVCDSKWEQEFCRAVQDNQYVVSYVKNLGMGFEIPYKYAGAEHMYMPDFIILANDGHGTDDLLRLVVEVKGEENDMDLAKKSTVDTYWINGVNALGRFGRWKFLQLTDPYLFDAELNKCLHPDQLTSQ